MRGRETGREGERKKIVGPGKQQGKTKQFGCWSGWYSYSRIEWNVFEMLIEL